MSNQIQKFFLTNLEGQGEGDVFIGDNYGITDEISGVRMVEWDGWDGDFEEWYEDGYQYYNCTLIGTKDQVQHFLNEHFLGVILDDVLDKVEDTL